MKRNWIKQATVGTIAFVVLAMVGLFLCRGALLRSMANRKIESISNRYGLDISYAKLAMPSLSAVRMEGLSVVPLRHDTLLEIDDLKVSFYLLPLLRGNISIREVEADGLRLHFIKEKDASNFDFLFRASTDNVKSHPVRGKVSYDARVEKALDVLFRLLPRNARLRRLVVTGQRDSVQTCFDIPECWIHDSRFKADIRVAEGDLHNEWKVDGVLDHSDRTIEGHISSARQGRQVVLPYIRPHYHTFVGFDSVAFHLTQSAADSHLMLNGTASVDGLQVFHARLSPDTIGIDRSSLDYQLHVGADYIELDSLSTVVFNRLNFHPYIRAEKKDKWHFTVAVQKPSFPAQELFSSLPTALFGHLQGIEVDGTLSYDFLLDADFACLDSLKFHSDLVGHAFRIRRMGSSDLMKMSGEFEYTAYDGDVPVRTFAVGPSNPSFRTLDQISPLLQTAIMQSEDGHFYFHQGFYPGAIQEALIYDLKERRFARGGSSITMQLVKNVFLNKHKNIARKLEEALIVWLIENQRLTSKDRMYEVYLNIAEWGPRVYGASEASHFYFSKEPSELTMQEAIFMASVIPRPKHFYWSFNPDGTLRDSQAGYFRQIAQRLAVKGLISDEQATNIQPTVEISGPAIGFIIKKDTLGLPLDSLSH